MFIDTSPLCLSGDRIPVGARFSTRPDRPWGPPSLLYNGYRLFPGGKERPGRDTDPSPTSSAVGHERVELYLYSPYGPYGLYRASVPVQGWPLPSRCLVLNKLHLFSVELSRQLFSVKIGVKYLTLSNITPGHCLGTSHGSLLVIPCHKLCLLHCFHMLKTTRLRKLTLLP